MSTCTSNFRHLSVYKDLLTGNITFHFWEFSVWLFFTTVTFTVLLILADSPFPTCQAHVLHLTQKHLTNKPWFMTPLKGVIWGFWWMLGGKTKKKKRELDVSSRSYTLSSHLALRRSDFLTCGEVNGWQNTLTTSPHLLLLRQSSESVGEELVNAGNNGQPRLKHDSTLVACK